MNSDLMNSLSYSVADLNCEIHENFNVYWGIFSTFFSRNLQGL